MYHNIYMQIIINKKDSTYFSYYSDIPGYYKDLVYSKIRNYVQPYVSTNYSATQITNHIYISDLSSAFNKNKLKDDGITHILTTVLGIDPIFPNEFKYKNIHLRDVVHEDIMSYLDECCDYIDECINNNGKILVHCSYGISRSASIVIAYLIKYGKTYDEAYNIVKQKRPIIEPNEGFKDQLIEYSIKIKK